jgi:hypothetical protein
MRHSTPKISKMIRDLARDAYCKEGHLKKEYRDRHGLGMFRSVLLREGVAIKFARSDRYIEMNRGEWGSWMRMPKVLRELSAKPLCISSCGRVMAVELIPETLSQHGDKHGDPYHMRLRDFNKKLKELLENSGIFTTWEIGALMSDNHANNIGVRENGELCWIDYAGA